MLTRKGSFSAPLCCLPPLCTVSLPLFFELSMKTHPLLTTFTFPINCSKQTVDTRNREGIIMRCGNRPSKRIFVEHKAAWSQHENKSFLMEQLQKHWCVA